MEEFWIAPHQNPAFAGANLFTGLTELDVGEPKVALRRVILARVYGARQESKLAITELEKVISEDPDGAIDSVVRVQTLLAN
jgi:hypothetical protein